MTLFSQRKGIRPTKKMLQIESIDEDLRTGLWNDLTRVLWQHWSPRDRIGFQDPYAKEVEEIGVFVWSEYFGQALDTTPPFRTSKGASLYETMRVVVFDGDWWRVYDLVEFLIKATPFHWKDKLRNTLNESLQAGNAGYRIVGDEVIEITDDHEIEVIETALQYSLRTAQSHLTRALELLSDRTQPDYRNSVKESISAVETVCRLAANKPKATLSDCLMVLRNFQWAMHPAFEAALTKLYGYASDEGGIRHSLTDEGISPTFADAKFMLVVCSAFVNFLLAKASEIGMNLQES